MADSDEIQRLQRLISQQNPAAVHLRPPRHPTTLCGLPARSARTTGKLSCASCSLCVAALREAVLLRNQELLKKQIEELERIGASTQPPEMPAPVAIPPET